MKKKSPKAKPIAYEYDIKYSQSTILADIILGGFFLLSGSALALYWKTWAVVFFPLVGAVMIWFAVKRGFNQGSQLKIGQQGIWTVKTGHLPWARIRAEVKTETGARSVSTSLVISNRFNPIQTLAWLDTRNLDVDVRSLKVYLEKFAPL